jgi:3-oxoacyl-[acyl-carrier-protein] synthase-1
MKAVYWVEDCALTPLAFTSEENYLLIKEGQTAVANQAQFSLNEKPFFASLFTEEQRIGLEDELLELRHNGAISVEHSNNLTWFETLCVLSIQEAIANSKIEFSTSKNLFILSTTKGNIELIDTPDDARLPLQTTAQRILNACGINAFSLVVSNACISGVSAIITAQRYLAAGEYENAIICGADVINEFVAKGFQALNATADGHSKPYDASRNGINLGEAAATVVLSTSHFTSIQVKGGSVSNDANHISGPSRTGAELAKTAELALAESEIQATDLAFISAHGTATVFNDEMESKAFELAGLSAIPLQSLKPHFGHTLGAAGVLESIISIKALKEGIVLPSLNYSDYGVSGKITVNPKKQAVYQRNILKTASGFGGCNASVVYSKK